MNIINYSTSNRIADVLTPIFKITPTTRGSSTSFRNFSVVKYKLAYINQIFVLWLLQNSVYTCSEVPCRLRYMSRSFQCSLL